MQRKRNTYSRYLVSTLLLCYAKSALQVPLFEVVHFIAHSKDFVNTDYTLHSYASHGENHFHLALDWMGEQNEDEEHDHAPVPDQETKKKIEIVDQASGQSFDSFLKNRSNFKIYFPYQSTFVEISSPPPQVV